MERKKYSNRHVSCMSLDPSLRNQGLAAHINRVLSNCYTKIPKPLEFKWNLAYKQTLEKMILYLIREDLYIIWQTARSICPKYVLKDTDTGLYVIVLNESIITEQMFSAKQFTLRSSWDRFEQELKTNCATPAVSLKLDRTNKFGSKATTSYDTEVPQQLASEHVQTYLARLLIIAENVAREWFKANSIQSPLEKYFISSIISKRPDSSRDDLYYPDQWMPFVGSNENNSRGRSDK